MLTRADSALTQVEATHGPLHHCPFAMMAHFPWLILQDAKAKHVAVSLGVGTRRGWGGDVSHRRRNLSYGFAQGHQYPFKCSPRNCASRQKRGSVLEPRAPQMHSDQARSLVLDGQRCKRDCQHLHVTKPMPADVQGVASTLRRVCGAFSPSRSATSFVGRGALREGWGASIGENKICNSWFFTRSSN